MLKKNEEDVRQLCTRPSLHPLITTIRHGVFGDALFK